MGEYKILPLVLPNPDNDKIDIHSIQCLCHEKLSLNPPEDRCIAWLSLLGLYPSNPNDWLSERQRIANCYSSFIKDFKMEDWEKNYIPSSCNTFDVPNPDLMCSIHIDVIRTSRHYIYFAKKPVPQGADPKDRFACYNEHIRRLERILYIFGSINCSFSYMQGFNELVFPFYFQFNEAFDLFYGNGDLIEAVSFQCLQQIVTNSEISNFYSSSDLAGNISIEMEIFDELLSYHAPKYAEKLRALNVKSILFAYKWFNLLFTQETSLPNILRIWDVLFSYQPKMEDFLFYIGVAHFFLIMDNEIF